MTTAEPVRLEFSDGQEPLTALADVNGAAVTGARVWPHDLRGASTGDRAGALGDAV